MRHMRFLRHVRRMSYAPPPGAGGSDNSAAITLLGLAGVVGSVAYVYYDPDVLPAPVKNLLPIQEPKGHGMSLEEYEKWRAQQAGYQAPVKKQEDDLQSKADEDDFAPPGLENSIPVPRGDVSKEEMKASIEKLLAEARENEAAFIADLKKSRKLLDEEDRQMLQAFKDEKARLKKELKFVKSSK
ncbi:hypothetical protein Poli38472_002098 [Pythium oligandrum]|uniref:Uncharacterized protein n=1 Tax=Pythium oligandrum TaxID=41045 RepID=A0A8K1CGX0_PYTOL|nr:hypothetical protein Poli38472_002098 [Pythium oligandrum]|eukprot:TMW63157.1 hypothetical protein Poli38472_002098 [Pythium oligandrum]